jgi:hypothetical protein
MARRKKTTRRRKTIPHPSITGLASGLIVGEALNAGYPFSDPKGQGVAVGTPHHYKDTVIQNIMKGDVNRAFNRLTHNASELVTAPGGRQHLGKAIGVAVVGAGVKKFIGNPKLGFGKFYFRI